MELNSIYDDRRIKAVTRLQHPGSFAEGLPPPWRRGSQMGTAVTCCFRWSENAIAFWDNRCAQHRAMWDYWPHTRSGTRVTVKGERPV
jgi:alpha-ketoglutarate-dependent taurine dioxygenase